tara:strand:+ start:5090 stop:6460 length:1371 start_codon:yes stop_codon:yes gene_type:complete
MIQYIIAAGIGAFLGSQSKKSKKSYAHGGEVGKTYEIKGVDVTYYEDSYEEGALDQFHSYYLGQSDFPYKTEFSSKKDLFDTLNEFISYGDFSESDFEVDEDTIQTSALVKFEKDSDWDEFSAPTEKEKELWRKGKMKLYSALFVFPYEVYKKEQLDFAKGGSVGDKHEILVYYGQKPTREFMSKDYSDDEAYEKFIDIRSENIKENDVVLLKNDEEIDYYDSEQDRLEDEDFAKGGSVGGRGYNGSHKVSKSKMFEDNVIPYEDVEVMYQNKRSLTLDRIREELHDIKGKEDGDLTFEDVLAQNNSGMVFAEGGMMQGYDDRLDESLSMRDGAGRKKQQGRKDRRDESAGMEKSMGRRKYASVGTMDKGRRKMEDGGMVDKKVIDHTNKKIKGWYKNAKQDHGVVGRGKTSIKDDEIIVDYVENGKKKSWSMAYYPSYVDDNGLDYFYNVWMEQA